MSAWPGDDVPPEAPPGLLRGIANGLLLAVPCWLFIGAVAWLVVRCTCPGAAG